jgi:hypothetical protein
VLAQHGVALVMHWPAAELENPAYWRVAADAQAQGISVHPWITLPEADSKDPNAPNYRSTGYFPNATNHEAWCAVARAWLLAWQSAGFKPTTISVDFEMRKERLHEFVALTGDGDLLGTLALLEENRAGVTPEGFAAAATSYREFVDFAHANGFRVEATTLLPLLEDYNDGDLSIQQGFQVVLDKETAWDRVAFQVHRTIYQRYDPSPFFVKYYAETALREWGERAAVGVGLTHGGIDANTATYASGPELSDDVDAALEAGIPARFIDVYSFRGMWEKPPFEQWFQPPMPRQPGWLDPNDPGTIAAHTLQATIDALF